MKTAVRSGGNPFAISHSPLSVSERAVRALFPYWTAAAPGLDCETETAHSPLTQGQKRETQG